MKARFSVLLFIALAIPLVATAATSNKMYFEPMTSVIFWVTLLFFFAITGRYIAELINQPGVLGELLVGILIGNVFYYFGMPLATILREGPITFSIFNDLLNGVPLESAVNAHISNPEKALQFLRTLQGESGPSLLKVAYVLDVFSRYGVIFLLFMVGLETSVDDLKSTGKISLSVAVIGVVAPIILGFIIMFFLAPEQPYQSDLFVAAALSATSIGISARVLKELGMVKSREAKTILGAAMIDDILGLVVLAIVSGIVMTGTLDVFDISRTILLAILFFSSAFILGPLLLKNVLRLFDRLEPWEAKLFVAFLFVMLLAWIAEVIDLATIIGAFAAGVIMHEGFFAKREANYNRLSLSELVAPLEFILAPLFFIMIGVQVKIETFFDWHVLVLALGLTVAAVAGKLVCGLAASKKEDRLLIGFGMLPRGEVGLIFASIGRSLEVMSDQLFAAVVLMVIVTTFIAPCCLKNRYLKYHT